MTRKGYNHDEGFFEKRHPITPIDRVCGSAFASEISVLEVEMILCAILKRAEKSQAYPSFLEAGNQESRPLKGMKNVEESIKTRTCSSTQRKKC